MNIFNRENKENISPEFHDYSKDADQTRFLRMAFTLAMITIVGLFLLEFFHPAGAEHTPVFFTSEITHILINGIAIAFFGLGTYIYGKSVGAADAMLKMAGNGNGGNGNGMQTNNQNQTDTNNNTKK